MISDGATRRAENLESEDFKLQSVMTAEDAADFWITTDEPASSWRRFLSEAFAGSGPFEWVTYAYLAWVEAIVLLFCRNVVHAPRYVLVHFAIGVGIALLARRAMASRNFAVQFARHWYPLPLYIFFFEELQGLVHAIFPGWFDRWLIQFDFNLAQVHPSVWLTQFASPTLNDAMQFAYLTYFLYLVLLPGILYFEKQFVAFWTATIELVEHFGRVHGAAFPSAHVAGSMVALLAARRYKPWLFWICLPFFAAMCVATVYGRYHYVADVIAGIAMGAIGWTAGQRLMEKREQTED